MRIHALTTGTVRLKDAFLFPRPGARRQLGLFMPGEFSEPMPIHAWVIEHDGGRILVDTGETQAANDIPFARFDVQPDDELPGALAGIGLTVENLDEVVVTHMHGDHIHLGDRPVLVNAEDLAYAHGAMARVFQRVLRQPLPEGVRFEPIALDAGPFGAFAASRPLTEDGRILMVATPGHTPGHASILCVDDHGHHVLLAGDATDSIEQLRARRPDAVGPRPKVMIDTFDRILAHAADHPLVYIPSHDPQSIDRLAACETV
jgi:N-acyl homoserine lactone hydrolase